VSLSGCVLINKINEQATYFYVQCFTLQSVLEVTFIFIYDTLILTVLHCITLQQRHDGLPCLDGRGSPGADGPAGRAASRAPTPTPSRGVVGRGRGGTASPHFFRQGDTSPLPHFFGLKFVQKLVHCCNWLLTETQCKIISVQQNYYST